MHEKSIGLNSRALMECTYSNLTLVQVIPNSGRQGDLKKGRTERKLEIDMTARKLKTFFSSKCISWTKEGNDNKKGCKQKFHVSTYHLNSFFQINCLTSFEISWVTTNMSINENVTKEKKHPYITVFKRHLNSCNQFILWKERIVSACFDFPEESQWYVQTLHCILNYWTTYYVESWLL